MNIRALFSSSPHPMAGTIMIEIDSGKRSWIAKESVEESDLLKHLNDPYKPFICAYLDDVPIGKTPLKGLLESLCTRTCI